MKLKKLICAAMVAAMSLTSLTAFATVPTPKDNTQAFIYAEKYFNEGLYYEAKEELSFVSPIYSLEQEKLDVWNHKVQEKITEWEISELFDKIAKQYADGDVPAAANSLLALSTYDAYFNWDEAAKYDEWINTIAKGIVNERQAIVQLERYYLYDILWDPDMYYSVEKVEGGYDIYVKSHKTGHNIAAYFVGKNGVVAPTDIDYNGNPASEYEWRGDSQDGPTAVNFAH